MGRIRSLFVFGLALCCVVGGTLLALTAGGSTGADIAYAFAILAGLVGILWQLYLLASSSAADSVDESAEEETSDEQFPFDQEDEERPGIPDDAETSDLAPERTPRTVPLSGMQYTTLFVEGSERAAEQDDVEAGFEVIRPHLRSTLGNAFLESGHDREAIKAAFADGSWTDDQIAAAAVDENVPLPTLTFRDRVVAWLFPHRVFREYARQTVQVMAETADAALPTVPGQQAPRPIPIRQPPLSELRRGVDGTPQEVDDPFAAAGERQQTLDITDGRAVHESLGIVEPEDDEDEAESTDDGAEATDEQAESTDDDQLKRREATEQGERPGDDRATGERVGDTMFDTASTDGDATDDDGESDRTAAEHSVTDGGSQS